MDVLHEFHDPLLRTRNFEGDEDAESASPEPAAAAPELIGGPIAVSPAAATRRLLLHVGLRGAGATALRAAFPALTVRACVALLPGTKTTTAAAATVIGRPLRDVDPCAALCCLCTNDGDGGDVCCVCQHAVPAASARDWADCVVGAVTAAAGGNGVAVRVYDAMSAALYRAPDCRRAEPPLLRSLRTSRVTRDAAGKMTPYPVPLEPPNLVDGAAAALLSMCELADAAAEAFVALVEPRVIDAPALLAFKPVLPQLTLKTLSAELSRLRWNRPSDLYA